MLRRIFHSWERRLASVTTDRVVRPFDWGLDWAPINSHANGSPPELLHAWTRDVMSNSQAFYTAPPCDAFALEGEWLTYPSALTTPHPENNLVRARFFPARSHRRGSRRGVVVLPQWNADPEGHAGLCRLMAMNGISALRLSLPYHDMRMPPELHRADYIVSANIARTIQVCRQAVLDARRAIEWLAREGFESIGILGTSLGSCLAMLTAAHEPLVRAAALNHVSPFFADVVWRGLSTSHVREGLDGHVDLELLRELWLPISPQPFLERVRGRALLFVSARYDLTFPFDLSCRLMDELHERRIPHERAALPCGHYSTGVAPFSWMDGFVLVRFLRRHL